jgi:hypothetical protein
VLIRVADDELAGEGTHLGKGDAQISSGLARHLDQICNSDVLVHSFDVPRPRYLGSVLMKQVSGRAFLSVTKANFAQLLRWVA